MNLLLSYGVRLWPGAAAAIALLTIVRRRLAPEGRLIIYILLFVMMRDAMTPSGLWHIGTMPVVWIRFARDAFTLSVLGVFSLGLVYAIQRLEPTLAKSVVWRKKPAVQSVGLGLIAGIVVGAPAVIFAVFVPQWFRGGMVAVSLWPAIFWLTMTGNLLEELLFRGYLQAIFERELGPGVAVWASGLAFAAAHGILASQLGGMGAVILIGFTLYEGLICAWLRRRDGVLAAAIAHGLGVFLVATGIP